MVKQYSYGQYQAGQYGQEVTIGKVKLFDNEGYMGRLGDDYIMVQAVKCVIYSSAGSKSNE